MLDASPYLLRPFRPADAPSFAFSVRESMATLGPWMPWADAGYTEAMALEWFAFCDVERAQGLSHEFGIFLADGASLVGGAGLNQFNVFHGFCNLGYWIRGAAQRRGAATAAVKALARYAFTTLRQSRVEIVAAEGNLPSQAVARRAGAAHEGLARNRLLLRGVPVAAHVFSLVPEDVA